MLQAHSDDENEEDMRTQEDVELTEE